MEKSIEKWKNELERAHQRIADLFARSEVRERSLSYLEGLLSGCERKNSWQVAEWAGEASPYGMQYLLDRRFFCAIAGAGGESVLSGRAAERLRAEEQLAGSRVGRGSFALWDAVSTGSLALGRQCSPGASERLCEGRVRGSRCSTGSGRDWIPEEGHPFGGGPAAVQRNCGTDREQPGRSVPLLCRRTGLCTAGSGVVSSPGLGRGWFALRCRRHPRRGRFCDQADVGETDVRLVRK